MGRSDPTPEQQTKIDEVVDLILADQKPEEPYPSGAVELVYEIDVTSDAQ